uniref:Integrase catalytic domain-containing protein n=1 Tax=Tanacetum cinerariifolium TaxID=118510 RepID=A0A699I2M4_TANCI|nr:hypothetical protein [Tanacetum cinerariifolium]
MKEYCPDDEIQKLELEFWNHKMIGSDIDRYTARFHELARLVPNMVTPESQRCYEYGQRLTTDGIMDGLFKKKENYGNKRRSNDQNRNRGRDDRNKRQRTRWNFALTVLKQGQGQRQYAGQHSKCAKCNFHHSCNYPTRPTYFGCGDHNHFKRNFLRINRANTSGGNRPNSMLAIEGDTNQGNSRNRDQGRYFSLGVIEAPQDLNVLMGTFSLNDLFDTVLFDSRADYNFISTKFLPLINMKPNVVCLSYEIKIASDVIVETNKIIQGCRLELEGRTFIIHLIPIGYGSFNVVIRMEWFSKLRAKIVCYKKIVQILFSNGDILEVHKERPKGNLKQLKTMKVNEPKLKDILVVRKFPGVFLEDLSSLPLSRDVEFCIVLILGVVPVAKSPYHLAPTEMQKLSNNLKNCKKSDYDYEIRYHPGKANVVFDALSRKEWLKPRRARAMSMTIHSSIKPRILEAHSKASKDVNTPAEMLKGLDKQLERKEDGGLYLDYKIERLARLYINEIIARHGVPVLIISDHDSYVTLRLWQSLQKALGTTLDLSTTYHPKTDGQIEHTIQTSEDMLRACAIDFGGNWNTHLPLVEFSYNSNYHSSIKCAPYKALYLRKCKTPLAWAEVGETYRLRLPQELIGVHDTFHVSNLKKCLAEANLHVQLEEVKIEDKLRFIEEPMEIIDCEIKKLKRRQIPIVKLHWNS